MDTITKEQADRIEAKIDDLLKFTEQAKEALASFASGPAAKMMAAMARGLGGGR